MTINDQAFAEFGAAVRRGRIARDIPLSTLSRLQIGGHADLFVEPGDGQELAAALRIIARIGLRFATIGDGSNLLFDHLGFRGVVIRIGRSFGGIKIDAGGIVRAGAGIWVPAFVRRVLKAGLAGATHAIGIPGTLGGLVAMNGGSNRRCIGEHVVAIDAISRDGVAHRIEHDSLGFGSRTSILLNGDFVVTACHFRFEFGDAASMRREAIETLRSRRAKFPRIRENCGSIFVSDPELYASAGSPGQAIELAGLKGKRRGNAQISPEHANFIVNLGGAKSADVLALIGDARSAVQRLNGVRMDTEVRYLEPVGHLRPAHELLSGDRAIVSQGNDERRYARR